MTCRRCGHELLVSFVGVPYCRACRQREHSEIAAMVAGLTFLANVQHQRLLEMSEAQARKARVQ